MIRQAISCDICGAEKRQTNHWFVAYTHAGELRISGWNAQGKLRAGSKHLCGQTCLNKLLDEFVARTMANRAQASISEPLETVQPTTATDASLTLKPSYFGEMPAERPVAAEATSPPETPVHSAAVIAIAPSRAVEDPRPIVSASSLDTTPGYASRHWRSEAWERERERERRSGMAGHRKSL